MRAFRRWRSRRHASGQTLVLFALMSVVLIAGLGLVIDAGVNYTERRNMQNAADTAALAGARVIARQPTLTLTRADVWNAVYNTAVANGAPSDTALYSCDFIDNAKNAMNQPCNALGIIPIGASGVRLRVSETHTTLFMRVIGIKTSGTAASSAAQVQVMPQLLEYDVPFMVCGVYSPNGAAGSILAATDTVDLDAPPDTSTIPPTYPPITVLSEPARIRPEIYAFDWNNRRSDGSLAPINGAPSFLISANTMPDNTKCGLTGAYNYDWHGLIAHLGADPDVQQIQIATNGDSSGAFSADKIVAFISATTGTLPANTGPRHAINGTMGCVPDTTPTGCVLILPIVVPDAPSAYVAGRKAVTSDHPRPEMLGRLWGAFLVTKSGTTYNGQLIKNYPIHANGKSLWSPLYPDATRPYTGPLAINLVK